MCGIVGFSGKTHLNPDKILYLMQQNSWKRGRDATGFYSPETGVKKSSQVVEEFIIHNPIPLTNVFIGHVRAATVGGKLAKNAHPFEFSNLVGVHNGTLVNHYSMLRARGLDPSIYGVDSEMLYALLNEDSKADKIVYKGLSEYDGAAALLFQDKRDKTMLYAYRNNDRPLFYGYFDKNIYISSIEESLKIIGCTNITIFEIHQLYRIQDGKIISKQWYKEYEPVKYSKHKKQSSCNVDFTRLLSQGAIGEDWGDDTNCSVNKSGLSDKDFLNNINKLAYTNACELNGRWIRIIQDKLHRYGTDDVRLTKGDWYFVSDYNVKNNYDIQIQSDDNGNTVWVPKFVVDASLTKVEDWVVTMFPIENSKEELIFKKGEVLEVYDSSRHILEGKSCVEVYTGKESVTTYLYVDTIRPATKEEISAKCKELAKDLAKEKTPIESPFVGPEQLSKENEESSKNFVKDFFQGIDEEEEEIVPQNVDNEEVKKEDPYEELIPYSYLEFALSVIMSKVIDIKDLSNTTNFKELKENIDELEELNEELFDITKLESAMKDYEEVDDKQEIVTT